MLQSSHMVPRQCDNLRIWHLAKATVSVVTLFPASSLSVLQPASSSPTLSTRSVLGQDTSMMKKSGHARPNHESLGASLQEVLYGNSQHIIELVADTAQSVLYSPKLTFVAETILLLMLPQQVP
jgi:hypothetical protein